MLETDTIVTMGTGTDNGKMSVDFEAAAAPFETTYNFEVRVTG